jgi:2-keto-4-pentenoate hydratase/2-oxohepta-3-ene-1,7-dioic acid hydratase in catechol pathway
MKLLRVGEKGKERPAILDKNNIIRDLSSHIKDFNSDNLKFETISKLKNINLEKLPEVKNNERIGACISKPGKFVAIGLNYSDHAKETGLKIPTEPIVFMKATSCISGPNDNIEMPKNSSKLDWEVELAIVVGKETNNISEKEAADHILGYCIVNDVSEREWQIEKLGQWVKGKSANTFGPTGPYLVTKDEIPDINNLNLILEVNGKKMQSGNTKNMIFDTNFLISYLSKFMSLQSGDLITTGTPAGVGMGMKPQVFLNSGDNIKLTIDCLGEQNSKVVSK